MTHYVFRLIPPRPTFADDMSDEESSTMARHAEYWQGLLAQGRVVVYGPVADPEGVWGLAVVAAESDADARAIADADPAVSSGMCTCALHPMLVALTRDG